MTFWLPFTNQVKVAKEDVEGEFDYVVGARKKTKKKWLHSKQEFLEFPNDGKTIWNGDWRTTDTHELPGNVWSLTMAHCL